MVWIIYPAAFLAALALALLVARHFDHRADQAAWTDLAALGSDSDRTFDPDMIADLPEPARRYFTFSIEPGTPLHTAVHIKMNGQFGRGTVDAHSYTPFQAEQILAPPHGLVWKVTAGALSGSDSALPDGSWTRFWLFNLLPIVRANGADHHRSAFGRVVAEAAIWAPASLLPSEVVTWEPAGENTARATVHYGDNVQSVEITVDPDGAPTEYIIQRWSNENADKEYREQPFGGYGSDFQSFGGYRLPAHVEGGNHIGTPDYFPFFKADVTSVRPVGTDR